MSRDKDGNPLPNKDNSAAPVESKEPNRSDPREQFEEGIFNAFTSISQKLGGKKEFTKFCGKKQEDTIIEDFTANYATYIKEIEQLQKEYPAQNAYEIFVFSRLYNFESSIDLALNLVRDELYGENGKLSPQVENRLKILERLKQNKAEHLPIIAAINKSGLAQEHGLKILVFNILHNLAIIFREVNPEARALIEQGRAVGKPMDVKGKSNMWGYVPFDQRFSKLCTLEETQRKKDTHKFQNENYKSLGLYRDRVHEKEGYDHPNFIKNTIQLFRQPVAYNDDTVKATIIHLQHQIPVYDQKYQEFVEKYDSYPVYVYLRDLGNGAQEPVRVYKKGDEYYHIDNLEGQDGTIIAFAGDIYTGQEKLEEFWVMADKEKSVPYTADYDMAAIGIDPARRSLDIPALKAKTEEKEQRGGSFREPLNAKDVETQPVTPPVGSHESKAIRLRERSASQEVVHLGTPPTKSYGRLSKVSQHNTLVLSSKETGNTSPVEREIVGALDIITNGNVNHGSEHRFFGFNGLEKCTVFLPNGTVRNLATRQDLIDQINTIHSKPELFGNIRIKPNARWELRLDETGKFVDDRENQGRIALAQELIKTYDKLHLGSQRLSSEEKSQDVTSPRNKPENTARSAVVVSLNGYLNSHIKYQGSKLSSGLKILKSRIAEEKSQNEEVKTSPIAPTSPRLSNEVQQELTETFAHTRDYRYSLQIDTRDVAGSALSKLALDRNEKAFTKNAGETPNPIKSKMPELHEWSALCKIVADIKSSNPATKDKEITPAQLKQACDNVVKSITRQNAILPASDTETKSSDVKDAAQPNTTPADKASSLAGLNAKPKELCGIGAGMKIEGKGLRITRILDLADRRDLKGKIITAVYVDANCLKEINNNLAQEKLNPVTGSASNPGHLSKIKLERLDKRSVAIISAHATRGEPGTNAVFDIEGEASPRILERTHYTSANMAKIDHKTYGAAEGTGASAEYQNMREGVCTALVTQVQATALSHTEALEGKRRGSDSTSIPPLG